MTTPDGRRQDLSTGSDQQSWLRRTIGTRVGLSLLIVLLALICGTVALKIAGKKPELLPEAPATIVSVRTEPTLCSDLPETITFAGRIEADPTVTLAFDMGGTVASLGADKGAAVTQGQVLMVLDDRIQTATLGKAQTGMKQAADDLKRFVELKKTGAVSESDYDGIEARADLAAAALKEAQAYCDKCRILSPISGTVEDRMVDVGEFAPPGMPVVRVANLSKLKILIDMPERDIFSLKVGQAVPVSVDALPGSSFAGVVTYIAPAADNKSNTFRVEVGLGNADGTLRPGIIAKVSLLRRILKSALSVPLAALVPSKGQYVAYVVKEGRAVRRVVKLVAMVGNRAVVLEGIQAGEQVIVEGQRLVEDGVAVRVADEKNAEPTAAKTKVGA